MKTCRLWPPDELEFLIEHYADNFTEDLALALERSVSSVNGKAHLLGLKKSDEIKRLSGLMSCQHPKKVACRFKKGHATHNKGREMPPEVYAKVQVSMFKRGNLPHNTATEGDGAIRKRQDYWYIRLALGKWRQLHTWTWEQANRPIDPKTEMIRFRDGNRDNCSLENLYLITRSENMRLNTIHNWPPDIKDAMRALGRLKKAIQEHEKQH